MKIIFQKDIPGLQATLIFPWEYAQQKELRVYTLNTYLNIFHRQDLHDLLDGQASGFHFITIPNEVNSITTQQVKAGLLQNGGFLGEDGKHFWTKAFGWADFTLKPSHTMFYTNLSIQNLKGYQDPRPAPEIMLSAIKQWIRFFEVCHADAQRAAQLCNSTLETIGFNLQPKY